MLSSKYIWIFITGCLFVRPPSRHVVGYLIGFRVTIDQQEKYLVFAQSVKMLIFFHPSSCPSTVNWYHFLLLVTKEFISGEYLINGYYIELWVEHNTFFFFYCINCCCFFVPSRHPYPTAVVMDKNGSSLPNGLLCFKKLSVDKSSVICTLCKTELKYYPTTSSLSYHLWAKLQALRMRSMLRAQCQWHKSAQTYGWSQIQEVNYSNVSEWSFFLFCFPSFALQMYFTE